MFSISCRIKFTTIIFIDAYSHERGVQTNKEHNTVYNNTNADKMFQRFGFNVTDIKGL
jgi:transketolase N-terminal domain/subunit